MARDDMTEEAEAAHQVFTLGVLTAAVSQSGFKVTEADPGEGWVQFRGSGGLLFRLNLEVKG